MKGQSNPGVDNQLPHSPLPRNRPALEEENSRLRQQISDLHIQLELQARNGGQMQLGEKDRLRRRAMELTQREQSLLEREQEIDRLYSEVNTLHSQAEAKLREADRLLFSKQQYIDELESARKDVATREAALDGLREVKEKAIEERREQVRLLEESLAQHSEQLNARQAELEARERALAAHEEKVDRVLSEREAKMTAYSEEAETALAKLADTQALFGKMDVFLKERRQAVLEEEASLRRQKEQIALRTRQLDETDAQRASEHAARLDAEEKVRTLQLRVEDLEKRISQLQGLLASARNENVRLQQDHLRQKDVGDTAERRVVLYQQEQEQMEKTLESQRLFILQLQKRISELEESHYYITNDHMRATMALSKVSGEASRVLAMVHGRSPQKQSSVRGFDQRGGNDLLGEIKEEGKGKGGHDEDDDDKLNNNDNKASGEKGKVGFDVCNE